MAEVDIDTYTRKKVAEHLALVEDHLKEFGNDPLFCVECLKQKHFLALRGYQKECEGACSNQDIWKELYSWLDKAEKELDNLTKEKAEELASEARMIRKKVLEEPVKHLEA